MRKIITVSANQTKNLAEKLAKKILLAKSDLAKRKKALIIGLFGDLGVGKTTFMQGFAKGLGVKQKIISPTFVILKKFKITKKPSSFAKTTKDKQNFRNLLSTTRKFQLNLIHIDAYRLDNPEELLNLGWHELVKNPENIILVEWANKIKKILPKNSIKISFKHLGKNKREIEIIRI